MNTTDSLWIGVAVFVLILIAFAMGVGIGRTTERERICGVFISFCDERAPR